MNRTVFAISDLHLGGTFRTDWKGPGGRLCGSPTRIASFLRDVVTPSASEGTLVIHGDVFDFLAEDLKAYFAELEPGLDVPADESQWLPFIRSEAVATRIAREMANATDDSRAGDADVFDALRTVLAAGVGVHLMIGNHDLEMVYRSVRDVFTDRIAPPAGRLKWHLEGEHFSPDKSGRVRIVHGNTNDIFNRVDYGSLNRPDLRAFVVPVGSCLVASVMNPIKKDWPFIDILKPEVEAAIPLLLWLDPTQRARLSAIVRLYLEAQGLYLGDADVAGTNDVEQADPLEAFLARTLGESDAPHGDQDVGWRAALGWVQLLTQSGDDPIESRPVGPLRSALTALQKRFRGEVSPAAQSLDAEPDSGLRDLVQQHWNDGADVVVAGHTHIAQDVTVGRRRYLNTGTWADVAMIDDSITALTDDDLRAWAQSIKVPGDHWQRMVDPRRWYAQIELDAAGELLDASLRSSP